MELEFPQFSAYISDMFVMFFLNIAIDKNIIYVDKDIDREFVFEYSVHGVMEQGRAVAISLL